MKSTQKNIEMNAFITLFYKQYFYSLEEIVFIFYLIYISTPISWEIFKGVAISQLILWVSGIGIKNVDTLLKNKYRIFWKPCTKYFIQKIEKLIFFVLKTRFFYANSSKYQCLGGSLSFILKFFCLTAKCNTCNTFTYQYVRVS